MDKCLNCGGELEHVEGRKKKKYCDEVCKGTYWAKTHKKEPKYVQYKTFKELSDKFNAITKDKYVPIPPINNGNSPKLQDTVDLPNGNIELERQISLIKAERIPKERDTPLGRKFWVKDQLKKIKELESRFNSSIYN